MTPRFGASLLVSLLAVSALAVQPQFLRISSMRDFLDGEIDGLSVDSGGRLTLAPALRPGPDLGAPAAWALTADAQGVLYAGTGNDGRVLRIENQTTSVLYDAPEPEVQAVAVGGDGRVYAATNPEGKVYVIDRAGKSSVFFDPAERYIWAMAFDGQGRLWVATGGEGRLYRVDAKGQPTTVLTSQDTHVTALAVVPGGGAFAGSAPGGLVYAIDARDNVRVLYDSSYREVKALLPLPNGSVYVALVDGRADVPAPRPSPSPATSGATAAPEAVTAQTSIEVVAFPGPVAPRLDAPRSGSGPARGAVFLVNALGDADPLWSGDESPFFLFKRNDAVMFGTGSKGRVYEVHEDRTYTLVRSLPQEQLTAAVPTTTGEMAIASSNPGKIQYLSNKPEAKGTFTSAAKDFDNVAQVGALEAGASSTGVSYEIRTGNASVPDSTWSNWEPVSAGKPPARSTQGRFAQIRATLASGGASPAVSWLQLAYVQRNIRPLVREITVYPAGDAFQKNLNPVGENDLAGLDSGTPEIRPPAPGGGRTIDGPSLGRKVFFRSLRTFSWRAEDANGDTLKYEVLYRPDNATSFRRLREGLESPVFTWDTATVPSGRYVLRVIARDIGSNPDGRGLAYEKDSEAFDVDNDPPNINATIAGTLLRVTVTDGLSAIRKAEWAKEAGTWVELVPTDGLADSREEAFEARVDLAGASALVIRATDAFGNVALARVETSPAPAPKK
jgi:hypothetical protein